MAERQAPREGVRQRLSFADALPGLGIALCFAISAIFVRYGLEGLPSPLLGVTLGITAAVLAYAPWLALYGRGRKFARLSPAGVAFQILAGVLIGLGTWARYIATDLTEVGVVLALGRINTPLVLLLSPLFFGRKHEPVTVRVWIGAGLIVLGSLILTFVD
jgi:uncharacterized membrane protein